MMMIKRLFIGGLFISILFLLVLSCSSEDNNVITDNSAEIKQITDIAKSGTWRITSYIDSGKNETNVVTASNNSNTITGTWSVIDDSDSSKDDSSDDDIDFNISFTSPPDFEELSDDWDVVSTSTSKIDLADVSSSSGGTDTLIFEKN
jgi:hypothetical protein